MKLPRRRIRRNINISEEVITVKKFFATLICGAVLFVASLAMAAVEPGKVIVGGVFPGMSVSQLTSNFGQPQYRDGDDWVYQNFHVDIEHGVVEKVTTYSNAMPTPEGVRVGQSADVLNRAYGSADFVDYDDGGVEYEYYSIDHTKKIEFKVYNGVISQITCKFRD